MGQKIKADGPLNVLYLEDSPQDFEIVRELLIDSGYDLRMDRAETEQEFTSALNNREYDIILADFKLPGFDAFGALRWSIEICPDVPFICVSGGIGEEAAIELMKQGAVDYVLKDRPGRLPSAVERALGEANEIRALRQAEEGLRESEMRLILERNRLELILKTAQDGFWLVDASTGYLVDVNEAASSMLGYTHEELLTLGLNDIDAQWSPEEISREMQKNKTAGSAFFETRHRTRDGQIIDVEISANYLPFNDQFFLFIRNITERKQAEVELRESKALFEAVVENVPLMIFLKEATDLRFLIFNRAGEELLGYDRRDLIGKNDLDLFPSEQAAHFMAKDREVLDGEIGMLDIPEEPILTAGKGQRLLHTRKVCIRGPDGITKFLLGISDDITERRQAEENYRTMFREMLNGFALHDILCDDKGNPVDYRFLAVNPAFERMTGLKAEELVGRTVLEALPGIERRWIETYGKVALTGEPVFFENYSAELKKCFEVTAFRPAANQFACIFADTTSRKLAEEELKQIMEKLRKSLIGTIEVISMMLETRDPYTSGHQRRVSSLARSIAREMGLPNDTVDIIHMAGTIHDIGKMSVPAEILSKPGRLSDIEMKLLKVHPQTGYDILKVVELPPLIAEIVLQHHERLDGSGYPQGLKNGQILLEALIMSVADVVEAMASHRPYRPALGINAALEEIEKNKGILYDEKVVEVCVRLFRDKGFRFE